MGTAAQLALGYWLLAERGRKVVLEARLEAFVIVELLRLHLVHFELFGAVFPKNLRAVVVVARTDVALAVRFLPLHFEG